MTINPEDFREAARLDKEDLLKSIEAMKDSFDGVEPGLAAIFEEILKEQRSKLAPEPDQEIPELFRD